MNQADLPTMPSCVLFDFDGTMYSFDEVYGQVWRDLYEEQHSAFSDMDFHTYHDRIGQIFTTSPPDMSGDEEHEYIFNEIKRIWPAVQGSNERLIADYERRTLEHMKPRAGLEHLLRRFEDVNIPWGIISNHDSRNRNKLAAMDLPSEPVTFMLSVEVGVWKPDTRIFEMALEEVGPVDRSAAVMVGDNTLADIAGGNSAGMQTVLMTDSPFAADHDGSANLTIGGFDELHRHWFGK